VNLLGFTLTIVQKKEFNEIMQCKFAKSESKNAVNSFFT